MSDAQLIVEKSVKSLRKLIETFIEKDRQQCVQDCTVSALEKALEKLQEHGLINSIVKKKMGEINQDYLMNLTEEVLEKFVNKVKQSLFRGYIPNITAELKKRKEQLTQDKIMKYFGIEPETEVYEDSKIQKVVTNFRSTTTPYKDGWVKTTPLDYRDIEHLLKTGQACEITGVCPAGKEAGTVYKEGSFYTNCFNPKELERRKRGVRKK